MILNRILKTVLFLTACLGISIFLCIHIGSVKDIPFWEINTIVLNKMFGVKGSFSETASLIVWNVRMPRIILAALVGASLGIAGVAFQGLLRNPLADPYIIGTSSGAAAGGVLAFVLHLKSNFGALSSVSILAFVGSVAAMYGIYRLSLVGGKIPVETFLLAGVIVGSFLWAMVSFLLTLANRNIHEVIFWLMGSTQNATWSSVGVLFLFWILGFGGLLSVAHPLNLMTMGDESASYMGIDVEQTKMLIITFACIVTSASVSSAGLIGFVGLMIPHIFRRIVGADHRVLIPASALGGAIFLVWTDTLARSLLSPREIPVGILTAILGAPFFLYLLKKRKDRGL